MQIKDVDEFAFIDSITDNSIYDESSLRVGIGDDCAVTITHTAMDEVVTTDMMVEGIHFSVQTTAAYDVGYRLAAANISDIAAMGARPKHILLSVAVPKEAELTYLQQIYEGIKALCARYKVNIIGGDTVSTTGPLVLSMTVIGEVPKGKAILRSGAQVGDYVCVTHVLGSSRVGLEVLLALSPSMGAACYPYSIAAHQRPEPQVELGETLRVLGATAMNDISDGLASELNEIAKASQVAILVEEAKIPLHEETYMWVKQSDNSIEMVDTNGVEKYNSTGFNTPVDYALYGGEDFQLVFTLPQDVYENVKRESSKQAIASKFTVIGRVIDEAEHQSATANIRPQANPTKTVKGSITVEKTTTAVYIKRRQGEVELLLPKGYNHFKNR